MVKTRPYEKLYYSKTILNTSIKIVYKNFKTNFYAVYKFKDRIY